LPAGVLSKKKITMTLHVNRMALDARLHARAQAQGTSFVWERVTSVDWSGDRVTACTTATGTH
jgi:hypothetical protein